MKKFVSILGIFLLLLLVLFFGLGRWLDVTEPAVKSDIVVCLGGGTRKRVDRAMELVQSKNVKSKKLLMVGESWYNLPYIREHYRDVDVEVYAALSHTRDEIRFIKSYMRRHGLKSALIVTDPPHSRRVKILLSFIESDMNGSFEFHIVGSRLKWWDKNEYYRNETARHYAFTELLKIPYNLYRLCCDSE